MRCYACGEEVVAEAVFCHKCGARLDGQEAPRTDDPAGTAPVAESNAPAADPTATVRLRDTVRLRQTDAAAPEKETELWEGGFSPRAMLGAWFITAAVTLVLLAVWIVWIRVTWAWIALVVFILLAWTYQLCVLAYRRVSVRYLLTNQRLIHEHGILRRVTDRIETIDIDDIAYVQSMIERLAGVGTIRISSSDRTTPELVMRGIEHVKQVADQIDDVRRTERRKRGLHIEQI